MRPFVVFKLPRTGSTMFGRVLDAHPTVECAIEYLNPQTERPHKEKVAAFRAFYETRGPVSDEGPVAGQTMNPFKYDLSAADVASAFGPGWLGTAGRRLISSRRALPLKVVVLLRGDVLKQAVSQHLAQQRGDWFSNRDQVADPSVLQRQQVDVEALVQIVTTLRENADRLRALAADVRAPRHEVTFEELQADPAAAIGSVFDFLGVPRPDDGFDYTGGHKKMLSDDLRQVVANYDDIERDPRLAPYLGRQKTR